MTVTAAQISQLRRMVAEPTTTTYDDATLTTYIERYAHMDEYGETPLDEYGEVNTDWTATYDLSAAAADVWEEKAAALITKFDFAANGGTYNLSQQYEQAMKQCRHFRARRMPTTVMAVKWPKESDKYDESYIGNLPEEDI